MGKESCFSGSKVRCTHTQTRQGKKTVNQTGTVAYWQWDATKHYFTATNDLSTGSVKVTLSQASTKRLAMESVMARLRQHWVLPESPLARGGGPAPPHSYRGPSDNGSYTKDRDPPPTQFPKQAFRDFPQPLAIFVNILRYAEF